MPKLTDSQLVILSAAAKRETCAVLPLPKSLKLNQGALASIIKSLLTKDLIEKRPAGHDEAHWREDDDGKRIALFITNAGLEALGIGNQKNEALKVSKRARPAGARAGKAKGVERHKTDRILDLLKRANGASVDELQSFTGWQAHSIRGALSGLRKKGVAVVLTKHEGKASTYNVSGKA
jgi:predicted transcriptional regulator